MTWQGDALSLADLQAYATEAARLDGLKKSCLGKLLAEARGAHQSLACNLLICGTVGEETGRLGAAALRRFLLRREMVVEGATHPPAPTA